MMKRGGDFRRWPIVLAGVLSATLALRAGDILRGGSATVVPDAAADGVAMSRGGIAQPRSNAPDTLARTAQALQAVQAMQAAARAAAVAGANNLGSDPNHAGRILPNVPDGLTTGGLQIATGVPLNLSQPAAGENPLLWQGARLPAQSVANGKTTVTVTQASQQALLTWQTFNVGKNTTLVFDQSAGGDRASEWIAFNKINDPTGVPSQILGRIQAQGQVYVLNQNGIIFGGSSQVNTHALVASSLPLNDNLVARGLLNNPDQQFLFSTIPLDAGANGSPSFTPPAALTPDGKSGDIIVQAGALITSPTSDEHVGGRVALFGPNVTNAGTISTPDGQTILAAGQQIGLAAHDSNDPSLRGLDVFVGLGGGAVTNSSNALIDAPRGSILFGGKTLSQLGAVTSSTSVAFNGRIDLLANYNAVSSGGFAGLPAFFPQATGSVMFGPNSVTDILPELNSTDRVVGTRLALASQLNVQAQFIYLASRATLLAPSASLALSAGNWNLTGAGATAQDYFAFTGGQIYLDAGAAIDVAGSSDVTASMLENIVAVQLRGSELANSPLQRDGPLRGQTVQVDIRQTGTFNGQTWIGTPLADVSGYAALVDHTVGELTTAGGSVDLKAGGSVVLQPGSTINVSGGWINYAGGTVETTKLIADGRLIDISQATPDRVYDGLYTGGTTTTDAKWGVTSSTTNPRLAANFEAGYVQGGDGGNLAISAPAMALDGALFGSTFAGPRQRLIAPALGSLTLTFRGQDPSLPQNLFPAFSPTAPNIVFQTGGTSSPVVPAFSVTGAILPEERKRTVTLSPDLFSASGFGALKIDNSDGGISVPVGTSLVLPARGALTWLAANINVAGKIVAPSGSLAFTVFDRSPYADRALTGGAVPATPQPDATRGKFTLASTAELSTAGLFVDDRPTSVVSDQGPLATVGGSIAITSFTADLAVGSLIDASGGVALSSAGKATYGNGGSIAIKAGQDPKITSLLGGQLALGSILQSFSGAKGGTLTLLAPSVQIGGGTTNRDTLLLTPEFFSQGGFAGFNVNGLGAATAQTERFLPAVLIAPGTLITPVVQSRLIATNASDVAGAFTTVVQPVGVRAPVTLSFGAVGVRDLFNSAQPIAVRGDLIVGEGAVIRTDPRGTVALSGDTALVRGSIFAPGGAISVTGAKDSILFFSDSTQAVPTVELAAGSVLSTAGATLLTPDVRGFRTGTVLPGGTINVAGNIVARAGAQLDVSGAADRLDLAPSYSLFNGLGNSSTAGSRVVATAVESNAGSISFVGGQELFVDATLRGASGGPSALGGSLSISSGRFYAAGTNTQTPLDPTLTISQRQPVLTFGATAIGSPVRDAAGVAVVGQGYFAVETFAQTGFDTLALRGTVQFSGPITLSAARSLTLGTSGIISADAAVTLSAPYVSLGAAFQTPLLAQEQGPAFTVQGQPFYAPPSFGAGTLNVNASLIDLGNLSLQKIGQATFVANNGDIRGAGTLAIAGDLTLRAGVIYPPSALTFTLVAFDSTVAGVVRPGSVTIGAAGTRALPLSAGGTLNVYASTILQGGTLRAPIGAINLGWDGTGTAPKDFVSNHSVSATQQLTLTTGSVTSVSAIDPVTGSAATIPFGLILNGASWIDPASNDITVSGAPEKTVTISAQRVVEQTGATIDLRGGGDLYAYRWVSGVGGTKDILAGTGGFAVLPGYQAGYAPYAPFNPTTLNNNFGRDAGYVNAALAAGDRVYLSGVSGLPAGFYTLLPARYALLPGAFLVTPKSGVPPAETVTQPDGASVVSGYRFNGLTTEPVARPLAAAFEVAPQSVVRTRAEYDDSLANAFLSQAAIARSAVSPRLPVDSGQLVLEATRSMTIQGTVLAQAPKAGRGGLVDISSPGSIVIGGPNTVAAAGTLVLSSTELNAFGAESLLIGGIRRSTDAGTAVSVNTDSITVDNAGRSLSGSDLVLAANRSLTVANGGIVEQTGSATSSAGTLLLGSTAAPGSGNGVLLRVTGDPAAQVVRSGVSTADGPVLTIAAGARLSGASVTLDSTSATNLNAAATIAGTSLALGSGKISLQLANAGQLPADSGLVLSSATLQTFQSAQSLSLLSYSTIDIYGTGQIGALDASGNPTLASLALHSGGVRGFNQSGGSVLLAARNVLVDNSAGASAPVPGTVVGGTLTFNAGTFRIGANQTAVTNFGAVQINASDAIVGQGTGGLAVQGDLTLRTPLLTGATASSQTISAGGALTLSAPATTTVSAAVPGLGASLVLSGAKVTTGSSIVLPSGTLSVSASTGDLTIGANSRLDMGGTTIAFYDLLQSTAGGQLNLTASAGNVNLASGSTINVAAPSTSAGAGLLNVNAPNGIFTTAGTLLGGGGSFLLDVGRVPGEGIAALNGALNAGDFSLLRTLRVRTGNVVVDGTATAHIFNLSADLGSITVSSQGVINAAGDRGGAINLMAGGSVTLQSGSKLIATGNDFDAAGKGGAVALETRGLNGGVVDIQSGSNIDLSVASNNAGSAALGQFTGTLHLRAPQNATNSDLAIAPINGRLLGASSIAVEGFKIFDLSSVAEALITSAVQSSVLANGQIFAGNTTAIANRLLANNAALASVLHVRPGAEIINPLGDLTLAQAWDLSTYRFGPGGREPGVLTLRAAGNLNFDYSFNSISRKATIGLLSDGFGGTSSYGLWDAPLLTPGTASWSYRLVAGADFTAADFRGVRSAGDPKASGSLLLGRNTPALPVPSDPNSPNSTANLRQNIIPNFFQVIRTGTGDIDIVAARDVQFFNPIAAIYTAGTQASPLANFDLPNLSEAVRNSRLGATQDPIYGAQFSLAGGNVTIAAQHDIMHAIVAGFPATLVADSSRELPNNWLYRRGYVDPATGQFGATHPGGEIASTAWWVDFTNFFEGVGALGGGNVTLAAGNNITNVDAVVPTNGRMPKGAPDASKLVELGGGDLVVRAGGEIDGGVYYVERGRGTLAAGTSIHTNSTRAALTQSDIVALENLKRAADPTTWLPTTLFLGKGSFDISARGDLLLGPIANPFLLPQGVNNNAYEKTYFSTYGTSDAVNVSSLTGTLTIRDSADGRAGSLAAWLQSVDLYDGARHQTFSSYSQPWLRLLETDITPFFTVTALMPATLRATAFSGDLNLVGSLTLSPSPQGTLDLTAAKSINGMQPNGVNSTTGNRIWGTSLINLSDADPTRTPGVATPVSLSATAALTPTVTPIDLLDAVNGLFNESGSIQGLFGVIQTKQALHARGPLHLADLIPLHVYAAGGDISGVSLFSAKAARVIAGRDLTDVGLYLQNTRPSDVSVVAAGRDLIAFDLNSPLRIAAQTGRNELLQGSVTTPGPASGNPTSGDIQISGPGTLEVLAGRNFDLGVGPSAGDGTAVGITSIGNARNPNLPFAGAEIIAGAGIGNASSLSKSAIDFAAFVSKYLDPSSAGAAADRYLPELGRELQMPGASKSAVWSAFTGLPLEKRSALALGIFYAVLRDAGRDHGRPSSPGYRNYDAGFAAIAALFPGSKWTGDISLTSREIKTASGGDISLFAPGGQLTVGFDLVGSQAVDQGVLTEDGGSISIFTKNSVVVGTSRIFTLRGGNEIIWSSSGNIAAGASSKTVQSAPPTRVLIDPQSGDVKTDLAGLATGGGIGVLATVTGVPPGDVDLIAPGGTIDAGDAGIRVSGNLNVSALQVVNASNIQVSGTSVGTPSVAAPSLGGLAATAASASAATTNAATDVSRAGRADAEPEHQPSVITVEVLGYGGGEVMTSLENSHAGDRG